MWYGLTIYQPRVSANRDLEELAIQFEEKCGEAATWKGNFEKLQIDFGERTSELESLNSQLHKAKQVCGNHMCNHP